MLTGYPLSCTLGRSVLGIGRRVVRFLMIAEYATYRYLRCVVNVILLLSHLSVSFEALWDKSDKNYNTSKKKQGNTISQNCFFTSKKIALLFRHVCCKFLDN